MTNPLMDDFGAMPPTQISLPSSGIFYDPKTMFIEGTDPANLRINPLSILDEQYYRDPVLLSTGTGVIEMIKKISPNILNPSELIEVDVDAILLATRLISFGSIMKVTHTCNSPELKDTTKKSENQELTPDDFVCRHENSISIDLNEFILRYGPMENLDKYVVDIQIDEKNKQVVHLKPISYKTAIVIFINAIKSSNKLRSYENLDIENAIMDKDFATEYLSIFKETVVHHTDVLIDSINFIETSSGLKVYDKDNIREWITVLPSKYTEYNNLMHIKSEYSDTKTSDQIISPEMFLLFEGFNRFMKQEQSDNITIEEDALEITKRKMLELTNSIS
jgi:hypothetical protein